MFSSETYEFSVTVMRDSVTVSGDSEISVLDGMDCIQAQGSGRVSGGLAKGLYTIRIDHAGTRVEHVQRHDGPTSLRFAEPERYTAVPSSDATNSRETYKAAATRWSKERTAPGRQHPHGELGALFVFLRAPSAWPSRMPTNPGLRVFAYDRTVHATIDEASTRSDADAGWIAFHCDLQPGDYVLSYVGSVGPCREMALLVLEGWQTQVFMTYTRAPLFGSASVLMSRHGFQADDPLAQAVDTALAGLQNGGNLLPRAGIHLLLDAKVNNPMLGLIGAHALLQSEEADPERLVHTILPNLRRLLGEAPDVMALDLIVADRFDLDSNGQLIEHPPVVRSGLEAVIRAAAGDQPGLVPMDSVLAQIAARRLADSPWSTWEPLVSTESDQDLLPSWVSSYMRDAVISRGLDVKDAATETELPLATLIAAPGAVGLVSRRLGKRTRTLRVRLAFFLSAHLPRLEAAFVRLVAGTTREQIKRMRRRPAFRETQIGEGSMSSNKLLPIGGLVAVASGIAAIVVVALVTVLVLAFEVSGSGGAISAVATGAVGVIGSVVGAYLGVKIGTDQTSKLADSAASAQAAAAVYAAHVPSADAPTANEAAQTAMTAARAVAAR
jgi:hypothetical protein